jgi:GTP-dependent phosphoenolpyruvate carboxykinase
MAGLNYFLTHEARGGSGKGLLGEKRDVHVWLGWLELFTHGDVQAIETPIGWIPKYEDLKKTVHGADQQGISRVALHHAVLPLHRQRGGPH